MSTFIPLRLILQQAKPDIRTFLQKLSQQQLKKQDYDLLLRKAVESKVCDFKLFCDALVRKGANINFFDSKDNISNLMLACDKGTYEIVGALLSFKDINVLHSDKRQLNSAFYAIENRNKEESEQILRMLLQRQPSLINKQAANQTLLIAAIRKNKVELVKLLLQFKADPNWQVPDTGNTPLHDAVKQLKSKATQSVKQIIRLLLWFGGDSTKRNKQQKNVYEYAQKTLQQYQTIQTKVKQQKQRQNIQVLNLINLNTEQDIQDLFTEAENIFDRYEGVNYDEQAIFLDEGQAYNGLTEEIMNFEKECIEDYQMAYSEIEGWMAKLHKMLDQEGMAAEFIGSFSTGLWIKHSNIDVIVYKKDPYQSSYPKEIMQRVYELLRKENLCKSIMLNIRNPRMPLLKVQLQSKGSQRNRLIYISSMDRGNISRTATCFINEQKGRYPILQPIFYVIKYLTYYHKFSEPKVGGLKTYALIIMLLSFIQKWNEVNPGKLLVDFLYYFGFYYEYHYEPNQNLNDPEFDHYVMVLHVLDPINPSINAGKNVKAYQLQKIFKTAYITLNLSIPQGKRLGVMFDSRKIL